MDSCNTKNISLSFPTPVSFVNSCQSQIFSLPKTLMEYIWMNPKSAKSYQKLIKTCKLLFLKNQLIVINSFIVTQSLYSTHIVGWECCCLDDKCTQDCIHFMIDLKNLIGKLWLTKRLLIKNLHKSDMDLFYSKLFRCDVKDVLFCNLTFKSSDIKILASKVENCTFYVIFVKDDNNGIEIPFHKLFELLPQIKCLHLEGFPLIPSISRDTVNELIKIQHFQNIKELVLEGVPNGFEIEAFNTFLKEYKIYAKIDLFFAEDLTEEYEKRLEDFVNNILLTKVFNFVPVCIDYGGFDREKRDEMLKITKNALEKQ